MNRLTLDGLNGCGCPEPTELNGLNETFRTSATDIVYGGGGFGDGADTTSGGTDTGSGGGDIVPPPPNDPDCPCQEIQERKTMYLVEQPTEGAIPVNLNVTRVVCNEPEPKIDIPCIDDDPNSPTDTTSGGTDTGSAGGGTALSGVNGIAWNWN